MITGITTRPKKSKPVSNASSLMASCLARSGSAVEFTKALRSNAGIRSPIVAYLSSEVKTDLRLGIRAFAGVVVGKRGTPYAGMLRKRADSAAIPKTTRRCISLQEKRRHLKADRNTGGNRKEVSVTRSFWYRNCWPCVRPAEFPIALMASLQLC